MKPIIYIAAVAALAMGCQEKKFGAFTVSGKIVNTPSNKVFLQELPFGGAQPVNLDSTTLKENGTFELRAMGKEEALYRVVIENGPDFLVVNDGKSIRIDADLNNYRNYKVEGSKASASLHAFFEDFRREDSSLYVTFITLDSLQQTGNDSLITIERIKRDRQLAQLNDMVVNYVKESPSPAARYYALSIGSRTMKPEELQGLVNQSAEKFPEHNGLAKLKSLMATATQPQAPGGDLVNKLAPDFSLPDTQGQEVALSSLKGKYVLVDFWASWCAPCRKENPNVVAAYSKFKDKNFTILGVSLDSDKDAWLKAIKDDKLNWQHVSDLKQWESIVVPLYQIEGIPFNVLLDPTGKIIASDLRGDELGKKLAEVLQ